MRFLKIFLLLCFLSNQASATVAFSVKNEEIPKTKVLFLGFDQADPRWRAESFEIFERIRMNLKTTDLFEVIKQAKKTEIGLGQDPNAPNASRENLSVEAIPDFTKYSQAGIGAIVISEFNLDVAGNIEIRVRMWDVLDQRQLFGKLYTASKDNVRKVSNVISNEIFKAISGESSGHFASQILYVSESGGPKARIKKINLIDFDGENHQVLTDGRELVMTPIFSKRRDEIFYVRYFQNRPQVFSLNTKNLRSQKIGGFRITTIAPATHPKDPSLLLLSAIEEGNSDIYEMNIATNTAMKLTKHPAIDTTPSYSPDGKSIAFSSDRAGGQQIYVMSIDGSSIKKISTGQGTYSKPIWSPDGKLIAFTRIKGGQFFIGVMLPDGKSEKLLSTGYLVEGAKWSPNGRYLIFSKKKGPYGQDSVPKLYIVDIITGYEFEVPTPPNEGATDPDWVSTI